jgi:hypothetical protein
MASIPATRGTRLLAEEPLSARRKTMAPDASPTPKDGEPQTSPGLPAMSSASTAIPGRRWSVPSPYGGPAAVDSLSTVAAPLLAGFSIAVVGVILPARQEMRFSALALLLLSITAVLMLFCVQSGFWARYYYATPQEATQWWSDYESNIERRNSVQQEQRRHYTLYRRWASRARRSYSAAIVMLLVGIGVATTPQGQIARSPLQWAAALIFWGAAAGEIVWVARTAWKGRRKREADRRKPYST